MESSNVTQARRKLVDPAISPYYHLVARCVRRSFLCGEDQYSGKDYSHRREWILERLALLTQVFTIDLAAYAIMSNHYHISVYVDWDAPNELSDKEVATRWMKLYKGDSLVDLWLRGEGRNAERQRALEIIQKWRKRLSNLSWFMKCLNEYISRRANAEDNCKGSFWESRFKSQALMDEAAILSCMAYVDLNPIRAGIAKTPEESDFTSIQQRILEYRRSDGMPLLAANQSIFKPRQNPVQETSTSHKKRKYIRKFNEPEHPYTRFFPKLRQFVGNEGVDGHKPGLLFHTEDYLSLVDWLGRSIRQDKRGAIPSNIAPILQRLGLSAHTLVESVSKSQERGTAHGKTESLSEVARYRNQSRLWPSGLCTTNLPAPP